MARIAISLHAVRIYQALRRAAGQWLTNRELAERVSCVSERTVRAYTRSWAKRGLIEEARLFPSPRYRWSEAGERRNADYVRELDWAAAALDSAPKPSSREACTESVPPLVARLDALREQISQGRMFEDSTEILRQARDERAAEL
ncbi:MAG: hypothetical protein IRZ14_19870 [Chloroflexi bacterium]|nr:hypothetical protein [Chloroflexota bacterium]